MIKVKYTDTTLSITGHANYAEKGKDIVCAAVSAIVFGAIKWFDPRGITVTQNKKDNSITIVIKNRKKENMLLLDLIIKQLQPIAKNYKKYIQISRGK